MARAVAIHNGQGANSIVLRGPRHGHHNLQTHGAYIIDGGYDLDECIVLANCARQHLSIQIVKICNQERVVPDYVNIVNHRVTFCPIGG